MMVDGQNWRKMSNGWENTQEFRDILGDATATGSLASYMSTFNREKEIK